MILAACEKAVQHVYEHRLRPEEKQHQPWIARVTGQLLAACREWDARLADRAAAAQPDQVLVTSTVVWSFIQLMIPAVVSAAAFPHIRALAEKGGAAGVSTVSAGLTAGVERAPQRGALKQERITSRQTRRRPRVYAGAERGGVAGEEQRRAGHLFHLRHPLHRRLAFKLAGLVHHLRTGIHRRGGISRTDGIDADPLPTHSIAGLFDRWITPALEQL